MPPPPKKKKKELTGKQDRSWYPVYGRESETTVNEVEVTYAINNNLK